MSNNIEIFEDTNTVVISDVGVAGPQGPTGPTVLLEQLVLLA